MYDSPRPMESTLRWSGSMPTTRTPALAKAVASGNPT